jgi:hypothetical protein
MNQCTIIGDYFPATINERWIASRCFDIATMEGGAVCITFNRCTEVLTIESHGQSTVVPFSQIQRDAPMNYAEHVLTAAIRYIGPLLNPSRVTLFDTGHGSFTKSQLLQCGWTASQIADLTTHDGVYASALSDALVTIADMKVERNILREDNSQLECERDALNGQVADMSKANRSLHDRLTHVALMATVPNEIKS